LSKHHFYELGKFTLKKVGFLCEMLTLIWNARTDAQFMNSHIHAETMHRIAKQISWNRDKRLISLTSNPAQHFNLSSLYSIISHEDLRHVKSEVLRTRAMTHTAFWNEMPCSLVASYQDFGRTSWPQIREPSAAVQTTDTLHNIKQLSITYLSQAGSFILAREDYSSKVITSYRPTSYVLHQDFCCSFLLRKLPPRFP
jgi:hypothetical protein